MVVHPGMLQAIIQGIYRIPLQLGGQQGHGFASAEQKSPESKGQMQGLSKLQRSVGGTPEDGQAKKTKHFGQPVYARFVGWASG